MINLLMFDLDGTLFDTAQGIANAFNRLLEERNERPINAELVNAHIGFGIKDLLEKLDSKLSHRLGDLKKVEEDFHRHYQKNFISESRLYDGVLEFLQKWPGQMAIVSNKAEYYVNELVQQTELRQFRWTKILGGNSLPVKKPDPTPIFHVLKAAKLPPQAALMIGDGLPDIQAAQNARVKSVAVSFGYLPVSRLIQSGAYATISHYDQLTDVIQYLK